MEQRAQEREREKEKEKANQSSGKQVPSKGGNTAQPQVRPTVDFRQKPVPYVESGSELPELWLFFVNTSHIIN